MKLGIVGLGKMGKNITLNLHSKGHEVTAFDKSDTVYDELNSKGIKTTKTILELINSLDSPKVVWLMVPAGEIVDQIIDEIFPHIGKGDIIIDAGNTHYKDSVRRNEKLSTVGAHLIDVGTSGGVSGALNGACTMIGGEQEVFNQVETIFKDLSVENGYLYTGPSGSGHFLKMVHNGIEYGMMQAVAEGFEILNKSEYDYDYKEVARVFNHGSVIRSWLMELLENAFSKEEKLDSIRGIMHSSGEGKWTVETALDLQASAPVIALSLMMRYRSLENDTFSGKVVAALRNEFGGHAVEKNKG